MRRDKAPTNNFETGADTRLIENKPQNGMWRISPAMAQTLSISSPKS